jgi:AcrR family transcriptional regulator
VAAQPHGKERCQDSPVKLDGFARRKEQSRSAILQAACELFSQFGVERISIAAIARKARVSPATIYNHFDSKEALAREFVTAMIDQLVSQVQEVLSPDRPFQEKMAAFVQFISEIMARHGPSAADGAVFTKRLDLQNDPELLEIRESAQERMTTVLLGLVQEGVEQGQVNPDLSEEALRIYFRAFMDAFADPQLRYRFASDPKIVQDLGSLMIYGLGKHGWARTRGEP